VWFIVFAVVVFLAAVVIRLSIERRRRDVRPDDLKRADDVERAEPFDQKKAARAAWDEFDKSTGLGP
jgi:hypothetical protein